MLKLITQFLRFVGIGFLNTAIDFAVFNLLARIFDIYQGLEIGLLNVIPFTLAVLHSYIWNKSWVFGPSPLGKGEGEQAFFKNLLKFAAAAIVGLVILGLVIWGAKFEAGWFYYLTILAILGVSEIFLWRGFDLKWSSRRIGVPKEVFLFVIISLVGVLINSGIVGSATSAFPPRFGINQELWTNLIKAAATGISLIWNFLGYKLFVFKR